MKLKLIDTFGIDTFTLRNRNWEQTTLLIAGEELFYDPKAGGPAMTSPFSAVGDRVAGTRTNLKTLIYVEKTRG